MKYILLLLSLFSCSSLENKRIILPEGKEFLDKPYGRIHRSCLDNFGSKLIQVIDSSVSKGMSCLGMLDGAGARKNEAKLRSLYNSGELTFICHETKYDWSYAFAHGSFDSSFDIPELKTKHPYISFKPDLALKDSHFKGTPVYPEDVEMVIFHELFHDIGYLHGKTPEYPYACAACCFFHDSDKEEACRICADEYTGLDDPEYIKRFWSWAPKSRFSKAFPRHFIVRSAIFASKKKHSLFSYLSLDFTEGNLPLQSLLRAARKRGYFIGARGNDFLQMNLSIPPAINQFAEILGQAQISLFLNKDFKKASKLYLSLDEGQLRNAFKNEANHKQLYNIWDNALYDMEVLMSEYWRNPEQFQKVRNKYQLIKATAPVKK